MADGTIGRDQPLILVTTTAGRIREDIYDEIYDEAVRVTNGLFDDVGYKDEHSLYMVYELDKREEWENPDCWQKANPGLGTIKIKTLLQAKSRKHSKTQHLSEIFCVKNSISEKHQPKRG